MNTDTLTTPNHKMTLRAWLTGMAVQGYLSDPNVIVGNSDDAARIAQYAVEMADACIAALQDKPKLHESHR